MTGEDRLYQVDVRADGSVVLATESASAVYINLDTIQFSTDTGVSFRTIILSGSYQTGPTGWQVPQLCVSSMQRVFLRGMARRTIGNVQSNDVVFTLPPNLRPHKKVSQLIQCGRGNWARMLKSKGWAIGDWAVLWTNGEPPIYTFRRSSGLIIPFVGFIHRHRTR